MIKQYITIGDICKGGLCVQVIKGNRDYVIPVEVHTRSKTVVSVQR